MTARDRGESAASHRCTRRGLAHRLRAAVGWSALAGAAAAGYMLFESQWLRKLERPLTVGGLPPALEGRTILHLSDVHAGQPGLNLWTFERAVRWAEERRPDLVVLTGDILGGRAGWGRCLPLLARLKAPLGVYAVPGNHEYGISKNPLAHAPEPIPWESAGVMLLRDSCVTLHVAPTAGATEARGPEHARPCTLTICGADYLSAGRPLLDMPPTDADLSLLLIHRPPTADDPLASIFQLAFAGHTHGGQIRVPTPWGLRSPHNEGFPRLEGVHRWGLGRLVISAGIGTTFLPFRLLTRPQAVLFRLEASDRIEQPEGTQTGAIGRASGIYGGVGAPTDAGGGADAKG